MKQYFTKKNLITRGILIIVFIIIRVLMSQGPERNEMQFSGNYQGRETASGSLSQQNKTVLFFYAPRCPSCRIVDKAIRENVTQIPSDLNIINVDYDTSDGLKKRYGVTSQTTFVLIDSQGTLIRKVVGLESVEEIVSFSK